MRNRSNAWFLHLRRFTVDMLTAAAAVIVAVAAIAGMTDIVYLLWLPSALLGIGLILEPNNNRRGPLTAATAALAHEPNPA